MVALCLSLRDSLCVAVSLRACVCLPVRFYLSVSSFSMLALVMLPLLAGPCACQTIDGALGGWVSWAIGKSEQATTAGSVQTESAAPISEPAADEPPHASAAASRQQSTTDGGETVTRAE